MIHTNDVFHAFQEHHNNAIVLPVGTAGRLWGDHSTNQNRDLNVGGAMGQATSTALGVALSIPDEKVVLFDAEGALSMNMGILATIAPPTFRSRFWLVFMVGYRGWTRHGVISDSVARYTEPFLNAMRINYYLLEQDVDSERISLAFAETRNTRRPVAVLVGDEYHGFNR